jgi:Response regulator containing a CheY-like receiver domain and an HD-GYP domain
MHSTKICVFDRDLAEIYKEIALCSGILITANQMCEVFSYLFEVRDSLLREHSEKVAVVAYMLSLELGIPAKVADLIQIAGYLHDIGKLFIPDDILKKQGQLTKEELEIVKRHPVIGANCLKHVRLFQGRGGIAEMVFHHHERWDGSGYPNGLKGKEIPLGARILAVADALVALTDGDPYQRQEAIGYERALEEIKKGSASQFDPLVVTVLLTMEHKIRAWFGLC